MVTTCQQFFKKSVDFAVNLSWDLFFFVSLVCVTFKMTKAATFGCFRYGCERCDVKREKETFEVGKRLNMENFFFECVRHQCGVVCV